MATRSETLAVASSADIIRVRQALREAAIAAGFSLIDQTKIVTAASELARNMVDYGGGGEVVVEVHDLGSRRGVKAIFQDHGPGIADIDQALRDGFTTGGGLGLGLGGARRLSNEFEIHSTPGSGTRVMIARWK